MANEQFDKDELPGMLAVAKGVAEQRWPHTMDAKVWAEEFIKALRGHPVGGICVDEGAMIGWFANAIMAGYDTAQSRHTVSAVVPTEQFTDAHNALNLVDMLLCEAGYAHDSSLRHNLSIAKSMFSEAERRLSPSAEPTSVIPDGWRLVRDAPPLTTGRAEMPVECDATRELDRARIHGPDARTIDALENTLERVAAAERDFMQVHKNCIAARAEVERLTAA